MIEHSYTMQVLLLTQEGGLQSRAVVFRDAHGVPTQVDYYPNPDSPLGEAGHFISIKPLDIPGWIASLSTLSRYLGGDTGVIYERGAVQRQPPGGVNPAAQQNRQARRGTPADLPLGEADSLLGDVEPGETGSDIHSGGDPLQL